MAALYATRSAQATPRAARTGNGAKAAAIFLFALVPWATPVQAQSQTPLSAAGVAQPLETRCGWFHNPTPNNATLTDRDGEWVVSTQG